MKPLKKSDKNIVLSGTLGGISEYFNMDPLILRLRVCQLNCGS